MDMFYHTLTKHGLHRGNVGDISNHIPIQCVNWQLQTQQLHYRYVSRINTIMWKLPCNSTERLLTNHHLHHQIHFLQHTSKSSPDVGHAQYFLKKQSTSMDVQEAKPLHHLIGRNDVVGTSTSPTWGGRYHCSLYSVMLHKWPYGLSCHGVPTHHSSTFVNAFRWNKNSYRYDDYFTLVLNWNAVHWERLQCAQRMCKPKKNLWPNPLAAATTLPLLWQTKEKKVI